MSNLLKSCRQQLVLLKTKTPNGWKSTRVDNPQECVRDQDKGIVRHRDGWRYEQQTSREGSFRTQIVNGPNLGLSCKCWTGGGAGDKPRNHRVPTPPRHGSPQSATPRSVASGDGAGCVKSPTVLLMLPLRRAKPLTSPWGPKHVCHITQDGNHSKWIGTIRVREGALTKDTGTSTAT